MKLKNPPSFLGFLRHFRSTLLLSLFAAPFQLHAASYQWDVNGATAGSGGTGAWDTTSAFWDTVGTGADNGTDATAAVAAFTSSDSVTFGGTAGTVTLATAVTVGSTTFSTAGYTLNLTNTAATTYAVGTLTGAPTINVTLGAGTVTAIVGTGTNNLSGFTGILNVGTTTQAAGSGKAAIDNTVGPLPSAATVNVRANSSLYLAKALNQAASITLAGGDTGESLGQLRLENATWSGPVTLAGAITGSGDGFIGSNSGSATISGSIGESGGARVLSKVGGGTIVLSGTNTFTGGTSVIGGTLTLDYTTNNTTKIPAAAGLTLGAATLRFSANAGAATSQSTNGLTLSGNGNIAADTTAGNTLTLDFSNGGVGSFVSNGNALNVTTTGTGTAQVRLPGTTANTARISGVVYNNTFAGTDANNYLTTSSTANTTATDLTTWVSGATQYATTGAAFTGSVGTIAIDGITFRDVGTRTVTIGGTLTLNQGVIVIPAVGNNPSTITGGSLRATSGGALTLLQGNIGNTLTIASTIIDNTTPTSIVKSGSGIVVLSGTNTFTGGITVDGGRINADKAANLGTGPIIAGLTSTYGSGYSSGGAPFLAITGAGTQVIPNNIVLPNAPSTSYYAIQKTLIGTTLELSGTISGGGANTILQLDGPTGGDNSTHFVLSGTNTISGQVRLNRGCVTLANANALGSATLFVQTNANPTDGNVRFSSSFTLPNDISITTANDSINTNGNNVINGNDVVLSGSVIGNQPWVKLGAGKLTLSGAHTNSGGFIVNAGTVSVTGTNTSAGNITVNAGTLSVSGISSGTGSITVNSGTLSVTGTGTIYANAFNTATLTVGAGATVELKNWQYDQTTAHTTSLGGLRANNPSIVSNGGRIRIVGTTPTTYDRGFTVNAAGLTLEAAAGANWTLNDGAGVLAAIFNSNPPLTLAGAGTGRFNKVFTGSGALTKDDAGTWTLGGNNTHTGATTINAGKLVVTGSLANTAVEVKSGATLAGLGNIGGSVTVRTGGHQEFALAANSLDQPKRTITGALVLESGSIVDLTASGLSASGTYTLATANGGITGTPVNVNLPSGVSGSLSVSGNDLQVTIVASAYDIWAASFELAGNDALFDSDPDHDGIANGLEWILGGDPKIGDTAILPVATADATNGLTLVFGRNPESIGVASLVVEWDVDLSDAFAHSVTIGTVNVGPNGSQPVVTLDTPEANKVTVRIPGANAVGGRLFARLRATK